MPQAIRKHQPLEHVEWNDIKEPGAYVELATGALYRVPREALCGGAFPLVEREGGVPQPVRAEKTPSSHSAFVRVSRNPYIFSLGARMICMDHQIQPRF